MFCTHCGHPNDDGARFCAGCGRPLQGEVTVNLSPIESDDDHRDEFPFPDDELEPGQALLLVKRGPNAGSTFLLTTERITAGRSPDRDVMLDDVTVSRVHAVFERRDEGWFVVDEGSMNGTYVNGEQVDVTALATGDEVQIGLFRFVFFQAEG